MHHGLAVQRTYATGKVSDFRRGQGVPEVLSTQRLGWAESGLAASMIEGQNRSFRILSLGVRC
jgi:hypothetical protein